MRRRMETDVNCFAASETEFKYEIHLNDTN